VLLAGHPITAVRKGRQQYGILSVLLALYADFCMSLSALVALADENGSCNSTLTPSSVTAPVAGALSWLIAAAAAAIQLARILSTG